MGGAISLLPIVPSAPAPSTRAVIPAAAEPLARLGTPQFGPSRTVERTVSRLHQVREGRVAMP